jgi:hypothetical protein
MFTNDEYCEAPMLYVGTIKLGYTQTRRCCLKHLCELRRKTNEFKLSKK